MQFKVYRQISAGAALIFSMLVILLGCVALTSPSNAATVDYTLVNVTDGSATFVGSFDFDTSTDAVTNVNIVGTGSLFVSPDSFNTVNGAPTATSIEFCSEFPECIAMDFTTALTDPSIVAGALDPLTSSSDYNTLGCFLSYPPGEGFCATLTGDVQAQATPLPAALPLFATGFGVMGLFGWRRKRNNAALLAA